MQYHHMASIPTRNTRGRQNCVKAGCQKRRAKLAKRREGFGAKTKRFFANAWNGVKAIFGVA